jgi:23S rRNA (adenine2503-C2)-methyltransferase
MEKDIRNLSAQELKEYCAHAGERSFRQIQIFEWLYKKDAASFDDMHSLPREFRERLARDFIVGVPAIVERRVSSDRSVKFLSALGDGERVESVFIPALGRATVCISSQAGCKFGCRFCASGLGGWKRDLSAGEMLAQLSLARVCAGSAERISHVVFMGTGEPLDNFKNVMKAIAVLNDKNGFHIGARRITISTCGIIPRIKELAAQPLQIELAVSLHGFDNASRSELMPINRRYPFPELVTACREYARSTNRQVTFEYLLIKDFTCSEKAALALARVLRGWLCKMNLIPYNPVPEFRYAAPAKEDIRAFLQLLQRYGIHATVRQSRGQDVSAACGQLKARGPQ